MNKETAKDVSRICQEIKHVDTMLGMAKDCYPYHTSKLIDMLEVMDNQTAKDRFNDIRQSILRAYDDIKTDLERELELL